MSWIIGLLGIGLLVFLHELGHFWAARLVGMKPRALYIGFGPAIAKVQRGGIEYGIGAIPLGGYTRIPGMRRPSSEQFEALLSGALREDPALEVTAGPVARALAAGDLDQARAALPALRKSIDEDTHLDGSSRRQAEQAVREVDEGSGANAYWRASTWRRVVVVAAGPAMNVIVAFLIFFVLYATGAPSQRPSTEVAEVSAGTPAAAAGLRAGDRIVAVDGHPTRTFAAVSSRIGSSRGRPITVTVERGGRQIVLGPRRTIEREGRWIWGFVPASQLVSHPLGTSLRLAARDCWRVVTGTVTSIGGIFRAGSRVEVSGPVGIARASSQYLRVGVQWYLALLALISMSIALFNLLPLLPLDGGNILVTIVEGIRGRPIPTAVYARFSSLGMALLIGVFVIAFLNDTGATPR